MLNVCRPDINRSRMIADMILTLCKIYADLVSGVRDNLQNQSKPTQWHKIIYVIIADILKNVSYKTKSLAGQSLMEFTSHEKLKIF